MRYINLLTYLHAFDFEYTVDILNTDFRCAEVLPFARTHT